MVIVRRINANKLISNRVLNGKRQEIVIKVMTVDFSIKNYVNYFEKIHAHIGFKCKRLHVD